MPMNDEVDALYAAPAVSPPMDEVDALYANEQPVDEVDALYAKPSAPDQQDEVDALYAPAATPDLRTRLTRKQDLIDKLSFLQKQTPSDQPDDTGLTLQQRRMAVESSNFNTLSDDDIAPLVQDIDTRHAAAAKSRGLGEVALDALKRGYESTGAMTLAGARTLKPGVTTTEDAELIRAGQQASQEYATAVAPRAVGGVQDIRSGGDALKFAAESVLENAPRALPSLAGAAAGALVGGPVGGVAGARIGAGLGGIAQNTGEAAFDQAQEGRAIDKRYAVAQGLGYSLVDAALGGEGAVVAKAFRRRLATPVLSALKADFVASIPQAVKSAAKIGVREGASEALQSQVVGRGVRAAQTGSPMLEGETTGDAVMAAVNEFAGGFLAGTAMGGVESGNALRRNQRFMARADEAIGKLASDPKVAQFKGADKLIARDYMLAMAALPEKAGAEAEAIRKRMGEMLEAADPETRDALATYRNLFTENSVSQVPADVAPTFTATPQQVEASWTDEGNGVGVYLDKPSGILIVEKNGEYSAVNNNGLKMPLDRSTFATLDEAVAFASDLSRLNQFRVKNNEAKARFVQSLAKKTHPNAKVVMVDSAEQITEPDVVPLLKGNTQQAFYLPRNNTVYVMLDTIQNPAQAAIVMEHENFHNSFESWLKATGQTREQALGTSDKETQEKVEEDMAIAYEKRLTEPTKWEKRKSAITRWLQDVTGVKLAPTDADMRVLMNEVAAHRRTMAAVGEATYTAEKASKANADRAKAAAAPVQQTLEERAMRKGGEGVESVQAVSREADAQTKASRQAFEDATRQSLTLEQMAQQQDDAAPTVVQSVPRAINKQQRTERVVAGMMQPTPADQVTPVDIKPPAPAPVAQSDGKAIRDFVASELRSDRVKAKYPERFERFMRETGGDAELSALAVAESIAAEKVRESMLPPAIRVASKMQRRVALTDGDVDTLEQYAIFGRDLKAFGYQRDRASGTWRYTAPATPAPEATQVDDASPVAAQPTPPASSPDVAKGKPEVVETSTISNAVQPTPPSSAVGQPAAVGDTTKPVGDAVSEKAPPLRTDAAAATAPQEATTPPAAPQQPEQGPLPTPAADAKPAARKPRVGEKPVWKRTQAEWRPTGIAEARKASPDQPESWYAAQADRVHKSEVGRAIQAGKAVPANVMADYPDIAAKVDASAAKVAADKQEAQAQVDAPLLQRPLPALQTAEEYRKGSSVGIRGRYATKAQAETERKRITDLLDFVSDEAKAIMAKYGVAPSEMWDVRKDGTKWEVASSHKQVIAGALQNEQAVNAESVDAYGITLPAGYVRDGDRYVFKPEAAALTSAAASIEKSADALAKVADAVAVKTAAPQRSEENLQADTDTTATPTAQAMTAASRFKPRKAVTFDRPIVGPTGARLVGYEWQWKPFEFVDKRGEDRTIRVSDWDMAQGSDETGRNIVHQFMVVDKDGREGLVSAEGALRSLGFLTGSAGVKTIKSAISLSKTIAKNKMLAETLQVEVQRNNEALANVDAMPIPPHEVVGTRKTQFGRDRTIVRMGDAEIAVASDERVTRNVREGWGERWGSLVSSWRDNRLREQGVDPSRIYNVKREFEDVSARIAKQERQLAELVGEQTTTPVTDTQPVVPQVSEVTPSTPPAAKPLIGARRPPTPAAQVSTLTPDEGKVQRKGGRYYIFARNKQGDTEWQPIEDAKPVTWPDAPQGVTFFAYRTVNSNGTKGAWNITETRGGQRVGFGATRQDAIELARKRIASVGAEKFAEMVNRAEADTTPRPSDARFRTVMPQMDAAATPDNAATPDIRFRRVDVSDDAAERYVEVEDEERNRILREFFSGEHKTQPWPTVNFDRVQKIWNDYARTGVVRDERGMDDITDRMIRNAARLMVNTQLMGHEQGNAEDYIGDTDYADQWNDEVMDKFVDYVRVNGGAWRISDSVAKPLVMDAMELADAKTAEDKLQIIDRMFNRVHPRGDVASYFIEGGTTSLNKLAGTNPDIRFRTNPLADRAVRSYATADPASRQLIGEVEDAYDATLTPRSIKSYEDDARAQYGADPQKAEVALLAGGSLTGRNEADASRMAREKLAMSAMASRAVASGDAQQIATAKLGIWRWYEQGTEAARALRLRFDPLNTPEARREYLDRAILAPSDTEAIRLKRAESEQAKIEAMKPSAVRAMQTLRKLREQGYDYTKFTNEELMDNAKMQETLNAIAVQRSARGDRIHEWWRNAILSAPTTQIVNTLGNAGNAALEAFIQRPVEVLLNAGGRSKDAATVNSVRAMYKAITPSVRQANRNFWQAFKTERTVTGPMASKLEDANVAIGGTKGRIIRLPQRLMTATDEWFKTIFMSMLVADYATREFDQRVKAGTITEDRRDSFIRESMNTGTIAHGKAWDEALRWSFQQQNGVIGQSFGRLRNDPTFGFWLKFILPFVKTPANIVATGLRKSPANLLPVLYKAVTGAYRGSDAAVAQGIRDGAEQLVALVALWSIWGLTQGDPDDELNRPRLTGSRKTGANSTPGEREAELRDRPPMSIRFGDKWVSYSRLEPFATVLATMADIMEAWNQGATGKGDEIPATVLASFKSNFRDKTFLSGVGDVIDIIENGDEGKLTQFGTRILAGFVPNVAKAAVKSFDPYVRETRNKDKSKAWLQTSAERFTQQAFPFPALAAPPRRDLAGRAVTKEGSPLYQFTVPFRVQDAARMTKVDAMLRKWNDTAPDYLQFTPSTPQEPEIRLVGSRKPVNLTDLERGEYQRVAGELAAKRLASMTFNYAAPTERDVKRVKAVYEQARRTAKARVTPIVLRRYRAEQAK